MESETPNPLTVPAEEVSIPFKREGAWKVKKGKRHIGKRRVCVSIPFKREGAWKDLDAHIEQTELSLRFNSLQTGRSMESGATGYHGNSEETWFQFPSNGKEHGKAISIYKDPECETVVSIPFKREGAWKELKNEKRNNGSRRVSIPFKREGAWKAPTQ